MISPLRIMTGLALTLCLGTSTVSAEEETIILDVSCETYQSLLDAREAMIQNNSALGENGLVDPDEFERHMEEKNQTRGEQEKDRAQEEQRERPHRPTLKSESSVSHLDDIIRSYEDALKGHGIERCDGPKL